MDSFQFNKYAMALLGTVFIIMTLGIVSEGIYHAEIPEEQSYVIAEGGAPEGGAAEDAGPAYEPIAAAMASADAAAGEAVFKKCQSCHTVEQGGPNKVGPNLYNIVGGPVAAHEGFSYSSALQEYGQGKTWTYEELNGFLWKPKTYVRGTAMGFVGLKDVEDRADVLAYLRNFADNPPPLPEPEAASAQSEAETAPTAEGEAASEETTEEITPAEDDNPLTESDDAATGEEDANGEESGAAEESAAPAENAPAATESTEQPVEETEEAN